ncbi:MAG TPA: DUF169 domain-containing protein [Acidimicrobiia bacterium]|nr:DUF169 domain-containing protein [Acidimicrobiia bacterium]
MTWNQLSDRLTSLLGLEHSPVAITFHDRAPANGAPWFDAPMSEPTEDGRAGRVAAPCVFWMHAVDSTFHTAPADHGNCSVGRYTHGLAEASEIISKHDVGALLGVGWVTMEAFGAVAALSRQPEAITYGPLGEATSQPDVVLLRLHPSQMMELGDAVPVEFSSKPQCQILPRAADSGIIAASMGCALSRARTGMADDELTVAIPGKRVSEVVEALEPVTSADDAVAEFARNDMARF